jgi:hypothetical protein
MTTMNCKGRRDKKEKKKPLATRRRMNDDIQLPM